MQQITITDTLGRNEGAKRPTRQPVVPLIITVAESDPLMLHESNLCLKLAGQPDIITIQKSYVATSCGLDAEVSGCSRTGPRLVEVNKMGVMPT